MIVRLGMAPRAAGLSIADAQHHWRTAHRDVALGLPGLRAYVQHHAVLSEGRPLLPYPGFDVCATTEFDDLDSMRAAFASEHYQGDVQADERALIDKARFMLALTARHVRSGDAAGDPGDGAVELMTFLRAHPAASALELAERLAGEWAQIAATTEPLRHEQLIVDHAAHAGDLPGCCDAIDVLWYPDARAAVDAALGPLSLDGGWALAGAAFGAERLIATPIRQR